MTHDPAELIHVTVAGSAQDPRAAVPLPPWGVVHPVPALHPEDVAVVDGLPVTSVARTLVDLAEDCTREELLAAFRAAHARGLLDMAAVERCYARVEWRPSLQMLREVMDQITCELSGTGQ